MYDNVAEIESRFTELNKLFEEKYHCKPDFYVRAPGRVNLIGEHIDYHGLVICSSHHKKLFRVPHGYHERHDHCCILGGEYFRSDRILDSQRGTLFLPLLSPNPQNPKFASSSLPVDPKAPMSPEHNWSLYFQCGYKGAFDHFDTTVDHFFL